jgi:hyperosmotically inducible protein
MKTVVSITALLAATSLVPVIAHSADSKDTSSNTSTTDKAKQGVSDAAITTKVKAALAKEKDVSATRINVDTDASGVVTLRGNVRSQAEADRAMQVARGVDGVKSVNNQMQVNANTAATDSSSNTTANADRTDRSSTATSADSTTRTARTTRRARSDRN